MSLPGAPLPNRLGILQFANVDAMKGWWHGGARDIQEKVGSKYADFCIFAVEGASEWLTRCTVSRSGTSLQVAPMARGVAPRVMRRGHYSPIRASMGGHLSFHGAAASYAAAARSTVASSRCRPTICSPIGSPSFVSPAGTVAAGCPVMLN